MACWYPFYNQRMTPDGRRKLVGIYDRFPCRWCISCRIDRRNYWQDRLDYAHLERKSAAFVTFTYDDYEIPLNHFGEPTLRRSDLVLYIKNLRRQLDYHGYPPLCFKNFQYYAVGEYGDRFGRPHYHVLFFGLDFHECRNIFLKVWKKGLIDSLPILDGGIRYVLKYMDKQQFGDKKKEMYDDNELEAPFSSLTTGIGNGLFFSQYNYIRANGTYKNLAGKDRPIPPYYRDLFGATSSQPDFERRLSEFERLHNGKVSLADFDMYEADMLYSRERFYAEKMLSGGNPAVVPRSGANRQKYGAVRQYMFQQYERNKFTEFDAVNSAVLDKLYSLGGIAL